MSQELRSVGLSGNAPAAAGVCSVVNDLLVHLRVAAAGSAAGTERGLRLANSMLTVKSLWLEHEVLLLTEELARHCGEPAARTVAPSCRGWCSR